jgi:hypothetical protein
MQRLRSQLHGEVDDVLRNNVKLSGRCLVEV